MGGGVSTILLDQPSVESLRVPGSALAVAPDSNDIPHWSRGYVEMALESDVGIERVIVADGVVLLDQRSSTDGVPETADAPSVEATTVLAYTLITRYPPVAVYSVSSEEPGAPQTSSKSPGASVGAINVGTLPNGAKVAVLRRQMNDGLLVVEAGANATDHYVVEPTEAGTPPFEATVMSGVICGFCAVSSSYAAYKVTVGDDFFWFPVTLCVEPTPATSHGDAATQQQFGQIGGDFYVKHNDGTRLHIATALKLCQPWIDHASHNR